MLPQTVQQRETLSGEAEPPERRGWYAPSSACTVFRGNYCVMRCFFIEVIASTANSVVWAGVFLTHRYVARVVRQVVQHSVGMGSRDQFRTRNHHHLSPTPRGVKYRDRPIGRKSGSNHNASMSDASIRDVVGRHQMILA